MEFVDDILLMKTYFIHSPLVDTINIYHCSYCSMIRLMVKLVTVKAYSLFQSFDHLLLADLFRDCYALDGVKSSYCLHAQSK